MFTSENKCFYSFISFNFYLLVKNRYLEPLYIDYRKMKRMNKQAKYELIHMDEFIDELLHNDRVCDISLPRMQKRAVLEELNEIEPRISALDVNLDDDDDDGDETSSSESESSSSKSLSSSQSDSSSNKSSERKRTHRRRHSRNRNQHNRRERSSSRDDRRRHSRANYVDYDNPRKEDEMPRYKRSPEADSRKKSKKRSSRSRSLSKDRHRKSKFIIKYLLFLLIRKVGSFT